MASQFHFFTIYATWSTLRKFSKTYVTWCVYRREWRQWPSNLKHSRDLLLPKPILSTTISVMQCETDPRYTYTEIGLCMVQVIYFHRTTSTVPMNCFLADYTSGEDPSLIMVLWFGRVVLPIKAPCVAHCEAFLRHYRSVSMPTKWERWLSFFFGTPSTWSSFRSVLSSSKQNASIVSNVHIATYLQTGARSTATTSTPLHGMPKTHVCKSMINVGLISTPDISNVWEVHTPICVAQRCRVQ